MSVTIDVNDVFEEVVKQNERLVKEIEFYEEVVNDLLTNLKTCLVCQQNNVIKDRINELETRNTKERLVVKDVIHINSSEPTDETLNYAKPIHDLKGDNNCQQISSSCNYESDDKPLPELISDAKPYSLEYEAQRDALRDKTHLSGVGSGYRCHSCDFQNYKFRVLEKHINRFHLNIKPFKCRVCCIGFYCLSDCIQHLRRRHNIVSDKIKMSNDYNKYKLIDETVNEYKPYSDEYVDQMRALKVSSRRSDGRYHCNDCGFHNSNFTILESHVNGDHLKITPYMCHLCPKRYKGRHILNKHRKTVHNFTTKEIESVPQLSLNCSYSDCDYTANSVKSLEHHITTVHLLVNFEAKGVKCSDCEKTFGCESSFYRHRRKFHSIGKSFPYINCNWPGCSYKTYVKNQMKKHHIRHTGIKMFACEWPGCDYKSVTKCELDRHCERHIQKREYKCHWPGCEYASKTGRYLKRHTITIHETTPYIHECHWPGCDKKFRFKQLLSIHVRDFHGLADKQCPRCHKMFKANRYLKDHMKIHDKS